LENRAAILGNIAFAAMEGKKLKKKKKKKKKIKKLKIKINLIIIYYF